MIQGSLFGKALPKLDENIKERNKQIREKTKRQTTSSGPTTVRSSNKIAQAIELIKKNAAQRLEKEQGKYLLIRTQEELDNYIDKVIEQGISAVDTETQGLDPIVDKLVGTCLYAPGLKGCYIPHEHTDLSGNVLPDQIPYEQMQKSFQRLIDADVKMIFHNAKFDLRVLKNWLGVWFHPYWDTSLASNFLNENEPHGLKALHDKYVAPKKDEQDADEELNTFKSLFDNIPFNYIPIEIAYLYAAKDPVITYELYEFQLPYLTPENDACIKQTLQDAAKLLRETEIPLIPYLAEMEETGVAINTEVSDRLSKRFTEVMRQAATNANEILKKLDYSVIPPAKRDKLGGDIEIGSDYMPVVVNIGSPTQLGTVLYDVLELKSPDREKPRGTGEDILSALAHKAEEGSIVKELIGYILEYRGAKKLLSTYIDKLPREVKEKTGRLHGSFNQYGAKTGRMSSSDPNLQNIPSKVKEIRTMIHAGDGKVLISSDFSQQEPRVLAHLCNVLFGDSGMKDAYASGVDLYSWMAAEIYNVKYEECKEFLPDGTKNPEGKKRRDSVKSILLGIMYGRGTGAVAEQLGWSTEQAQKVVDMFFNRFPAIKQVIEYYQNMARQKGYIVTVYGRKRRLPEINLPEFELIDEKTGQPIDADTAAYYVDKLKKAYGKQKNEIKNQLRSQGIKVSDNGGKIADAERQVLNSVVQGTSADITKRAMLDLGRSEEFRQLGAQMLLTVHDEIIASAPEETALRAAQIMSNLMINSCADAITVGMKCDAEIMREWAGKDITDELEGKYGKVS